MAVLPAHHMVDCGLLSHALGEKRISLASEDEIRELLLKLCPECELGATPPFGNIYGIPVYISKAMVDDAHITFNAGTHEDAMRITFSDYDRLVAPRCLDFTRQITSAQKRREEA
jgi:Ala-tRNA(Pro) deacylase